MSKSSAPSLFRIFFFSGLITVAVLLTMGLLSGIEALLLTIVLSLVEITFSFDNAIINAKVLARLSNFWQQMFLTVGIVIAVFGMRLVFPIALIMATAQLSAPTVLNLALNQPEQYAEKLSHAHPYISAFGGMFLLMLALSYFFDTEKKVHWLHQLERPVSRFGNWWVFTSISSIMLAAVVIAPMNHHHLETLTAGIVGIVTYLLLHLFTNSTQTSDESNVKKTGMAAFGSFLYLQVLDASFSFDGVIGAFAITQDIIIIAAGLGIGAVWVRSLTVMMVKHGTLDSYRFLEHGAHYTIGMLAVVFLTGLFFDMPEAVAGILGLGIIGSSIIASIRHKRRNP